jgi:hypothetical protein
LAQGEVAINVTDKKVWVGNAATTPVQLIGTGADGSLSTLTVGAGTVSLPSITTTGDTNTGIFFPAADTIAFTEGGVESMRIDDSGYLLLNRTTTINSSKFAINTTSASGVQQGIVINNPYGFGAGLGTAASALTFTRMTGATYVPVASIQGGNTSESSSNRGELSFFTQTTVAGGLVERMRITSDGYVGIGTSSPYRPLQVKTTDGATALVLSPTSTTTGTVVRMDASNETGAGFVTLNLRTHETIFTTNGSERMRIDSSGNLLVGKTSTLGTVDGCTLTSGVDIAALFTSSNATGTVYINRQASDGVLITLRQAGTQEGNISVSGTTVSYNGGHLARYAQTPTAKDDSILKGTVLSNLDEMNTYADANGNPVENEQLNKVKVSDTEGDADVAGVFVNWSFDEQHNVDEINMAMTGDMIIRIAEGVTVQRGDLLMSAGDGTAKPQGDDIVRSKTIAKVTSTHVTCTYADGSYCVPCVLMAC